MIQRKQTVFLVLAVAALGYAAFLSPMAPGTADWIDTAVLVATALAAVVALAGIFLYAKRDTQRSVIAKDQIAALGGIAFVGVGFFQDLQLGGMPEISPTEWTLVGVVILGYVMLWLARRGVEADIKLLKSVDRLR